MSISTNAKLMNLTKILLGNLHFIAKWINPFTVINIPYLLHRKTVSMHMMKVTVHKNICYTL